MTSLCHRELNNICCWCCCWRRWWTEELMKLQLQS